MKTKKLSLANIEGKLSRAEMKNIMAGSGGDCQGFDQQCSTINHLNCCTGYTCANFKCAVPTAPAP